MKINSLQRENIIQLVGFLDSHEWGDIVEMLTDRRADKVKQLVLGGEKDERNRGAIQEIDFLLGLRKYLLDQKDMLDSSQTKE